MKIEIYDEIVRNRLRKGLYDKNVKLIKVILEIIRDNMKKDNNKPIIE